MNKIIFASGLLFISSAFAQTPSIQVDCSQFRANSDGWKSLSSTQININGHSIQFGPNIEIHRGDRFSGVDLSMVLDAAC
jgi:hypothetical protein